MASKFDDLHLFVREALGRGISRTEVMQALNDAGWERKRAESALASFADTTFPVPVPRPSPSISAREAFFYLILFAALALFAFSLGSLLFRIIENLLPEAGEAGYLTQQRESSIRWSSASVIVALPIFFYLSLHVSTAIADGRLPRSSGVRLWLSYLAMFVAVCAVMSDLVTLIAYLLAGDATLRFLLKVLVVAAIGLSVLANYLIDLRRAEQK